MKSSHHDDQEFEQLLAASSERELTSWEHDRLWTLLQNSPERVSRWRQHCRLVGLLGSFEESELVERGISVSPSNVTSLPVSSSPGSRKPISYRVIGTALASSVAILGAMIWNSKRSHEENRHDLVVVGEERGVRIASISDSTGGMAVTPEAPEEKYERVMATLPLSGSQDRPASPISNALADASKMKVDFNNDIRPIFADKCFHCHGPDENSRKADLRLDTEKGAFADLGGYFAIERGDAEASEAVLRMFDDDPDSIMPPPEFHKPMTAEEKAKIIAWIDAGAEWSGHWAFEPIENLDTPVVEKGDWVANKIDTFILAVMEEKGLEPNPEADRYALARRAALDLIGLPPTPEELETFLKDDSENAYEEYVDRLLDSPHYGEHRARFWLDAARYADTHGMHLDNYREMWLYRDWVINAFNQNQPFDQFSIEQLAGDLFETPTRDQLIATGFNRNHITTAEGGAIPAELEVRYMSDRADTMSTVFMGLTAGCAACHDHKYDPISQKEYYALTAFFANNETPAMDGNMRDHHPTVVVPNPEDAAEWERLMERREALRAALEASASDAKVKSWWNSAKPAALSFRHPVSDQSLALDLLLDDIREGRTTAYVYGKPVEIGIGKAVPAKEHPHGDRGVRFPERGGISLDFEAPFTPDSEVTFSYWVRSPDRVVAQDLIRQNASENKEKDLKKTGYSIAGNSGGGGFTFTVNDDEGTSITSLMPAETPLLPKSWQHVAVRYSGGRDNSSITFYVDGRRRYERRRDSQMAGTVFADHLPRELLIGSNAVTSGISDLRIFSRSLSVDEIELLAREFELRDLVTQRPSY
ncbi:MAG: DUF1549 domain-containing protein, partial [Verrucomicrobiota bacterium]